MESLCLKKPEQQLGGLPVCLYCMQRPGKKMRGEIINQSGFGCTPYPPTTPNLTHWRDRKINPFSPKSDQFQISPAASPVILHHILWRIRLFIALLRCKIIILPILTTSLILLLFKRLWECTFWTWDWKGQPFHSMGNQFQVSPELSPEINSTTQYEELFIAYSDERCSYYQFSLHHWMVGGGACLSGQRSSNSVLSF